MTISDNEQQIDSMVFSPNIVVEVRTKNHCCSEFVSSLKLALRHQLNTPLALGDLANIFCLSRRTLSRRLKDAGICYRTLLKELRYEIAGELLTTTDMPISEIAKDVGYQDSSNFTKAFRQWAGMTPRTYRSQHKVVG